MLGTVLLQKIEGAATRGCSVATRIGTLTGREYARHARGSQRIDDDFT